MPDTLKVYGGSIVRVPSPATPAGEGVPVLYWSPASSGDLIATTEWANALVDAYNAREAQRAAAAEAGEYIPLPLAAKATGDDPRNLARACQRGTVPGAFRPFGQRGWLIPAGLVREGRKLLNPTRGKPRKAA